MVPRCWFWEIPFVRPCLHYCKAHNNTKTIHWVCIFAKVLLCCQLTARVHQY